MKQATLPFNPAVSYDKPFAFKIFCDRIGRVTVDPSELDVFSAYLDTAFAELVSQGLILSKDNVEDSALVADYCNFVVYRGTTNIPPSLDRRIRHRFLIDGVMPPPVVETPPVEEEPEEEEDPSEPLELTPVP
jgi:hypothetical protein